jgi:Ser/Thr protein kinase RdoA (MazF antagonist)
MKAYEDLTRRGKLQRTGRIAQVALEAYGFTEARLRLIVDAGNTTYRVKTVDPTPIGGSLYVDNCYSLRLHWPGYQNEGAVDSELEWLSSLSDAGLPVPQPVPTIEGDLSVEVSVEGVPGARRCSLLRWVKGRMATKLVRPWHMKAIGGLMARLHDHASSWRPSDGFVRRHYDRNGLWGDDTGTGYTTDEVWPMIPRRYFEAFREVTMRVERVMDDWGKGPDVYGLIHADLGTKANVLFHDREARAIDFDDGGFGYWMYDLAMPLSDWEGEDVWPAFREALLEGYTEMRSIPEEQLRYLELFQAAIRAMEIFWGTACTMRRPDSTYWMERRDEAWRHIKRYLKENPKW